ncbi:MAG: ACP S-malonyltransferase, partial [Deltaproteobacteria bacterium]|nr:ACP S-malonyltransferase [Deltaproteobacteria bacterium]
MKKTALIFPGQGSQSVGMGKEFFDVSKGAQEVFEIANASLDVDIKDLCFSGPVEELSKTEITQPAILTASIAVLRGIREECELDAAYVAGHSLGEYTALVCAGVLELSDAIKLVSNRGRFMQESVPEGLGAMSAVIGLDNDMVIEECRKASTGDEQVVAANLNSPGQVVISGN